MEKTDIRNCVGTLPEVDFIGIDVSFISLKLVLPSAYALLKDGGECVALIKPQFEAGKSHLSKHGIVRDSKVHKKYAMIYRSLPQLLGLNGERSYPRP